MYRIDTTEEPQCFEFAIDGDGYRVPLLDALPADAMDSLARRIADAPADGRASAFVGELRGIFEEHAPGALSRITRGQWRGLATAYIEASGVSAGE